MRFFFAFLAGCLTTLSPCVLPVLPFVTTSSFNKNRLGPAFLGAGLLFSFVGVSLVISSTGYLLGIDSGVIRKVAGALLALSGLFFLSQSLSDKLAARLSFISNFGNQSSPQDSSRPLLAEFLGGVLLGIVWTPCSGPSLGTALGLAAQGGSLASASVVLSFFGIGAVFPLMIVSYGARNYVSKLRGQSQFITILKKTFGVLVVTFGVLTLFGWDKHLEAVLTSAIPDGWLNFITKY
jgi:cytochrome c-type biogenesis protein